MEKWDLAAITRQFLPDGSFTAGKPYGSGHIHDTFLIETSKTPYILQRINHYIFTNPPLVMDNITRVTCHIARKLKNEGLPKEEISRRVLTVIPTVNGDSFYKDSTGNYWRVYRFISNSGSHDVLTSTHQAYQAAFIFGRFLDQVRDLPDPPLYETIPGFHNGRKRLADFLQSVAMDSCNRAASARKEIDYVMANASMFEVFPRLVLSNQIPVRVTHNDTKINNVMVDEKTGNAICVIDLDTVMPGLSLYDFGDLARTTLCPLEEDERDLSKVQIQLPIFEAILKGFLDGAAGSFTALERDYLVFSTKFMAQIIGVRFLTDYLNGDTYFKIHREGQNLDRARRQFKQVLSIIENEDRMEALVYPLRGGLL